MTVRLSKGDEKIAMLLTALPAGATESVLKQLGPSHQDRLRAEINRLNASPPPREYLEEILAEFEELLLRTTTGSSAGILRIAAGTAAASTDPRAQPGSTKSDAARIPAEARGKLLSEPSTGSATSVQPGMATTDDPVAELQSTDVDRLAAALTDEHPGTVSLVLDCLGSAKAGNVLKRLPAEMRRTAFVRLGHSRGESSELLPRVLQAILRKSRAIPENVSKPDATAKFRKMAEMLRLLERADRTEMLAALEQQSADVAAQVKELLYQFEDLLLIEDRSMQKLLAEIDSRTLALALKDAHENISEKVMNNLSKRARETLSEEIGFLDTVPSTELQRAQKTVVEVIQRLDQAGELMMTNDA